MRRLNELTSPTLKSLIRLSLSPEDKLDEELFGEFCVAGKFTFIFDGFDEVKSEHRDEVEMQILSLSSSYVDCNFVVSGRYDGRFVSWGNFHNYSPNPFDLSQVKELMGKVPFNESTKKKFLKKLNEEFFEKHESFLSNPLLCLMMLITYHSDADIPEKVTIFYENVFMTLFNWHDATKDSFHRQRCLDINECRKLFGLVCLFSYHNNEFVFSELKLTEYIEKALIYFEMEFSAHDVLMDFTEAVNLVQKDGLTYAFVHRSFQEYFCAHCISTTLRSKAAALLDGFSRRSQDQVLSMVQGLAPELIISDYIRPNLDQYRPKLEAATKSREKYKGLKTLDVSFESFVSSTRTGVGDESTISPSVKWVSGYDLNLVRFLTQTDALFRAGTEGRAFDRVYSTVVLSLVDITDDFSELSDGAFTAKMGLADEGGWEVSLDVEGLVDEVAAGLIERFNNNVPSIKKELLGELEIVAMKLIRNSLKIGDEIEESERNKQKTIDDILS